MRSMRKAIIEQLSILATQPESAPFAIDVATCNLEKNEAKCVVKVTLNISSTYHFVQSSKFNLFQKFKVQSLTYKVQLIILKLKFKLANFVL